MLLLKNLALMFLIFGERKHMIDYIALIMSIIAFILSIINVIICYKSWK